MLANGRWLGPTQYWEKTCHGYGVVVAHEVEAVTHRPLQLAVVESSNAAGNAQSKGGCLFLIRRLPLRHVARRKQAYMRKSIELAGKVLKQATMAKRPWLMKVRMAPTVLAQSGRAPT